VVAGVQLLGRCLPGIFKQDERFAFDSNAPKRRGSGGRRDGLPALRALITDLYWLRAGMEMLMVGALAAGVAYTVGAWIAVLT
jgi:hypothetical protein